MDTDLWLVISMPFGDPNGIGIGGDCDARDAPKVTLTPLFPAYRIADFVRGDAVFVPPHDCGVLEKQHILDESDAFCFDFPAESRPAFANRVRRAIINKSGESVI